VKTLLEAPVAAVNTTLTTSAGSATHGALPARPSRPRRRFGLFVRRAHLYSGLALVPFVLLYGITGGLLNHPTLLSRTLDTHTIAGAELDALGFAPRLDANELLAELERAPQMEGLEVVRDVEPRLRGRWSMRTSKAGVVHTLLVDANDADARVFVRAGEPEADVLKLDAGVLPATEALTERFRTAAIAALAAHEIPTGDAGLRDTPVLEFAVRRDGSDFTATFDPQNRSLELEPRAAVTSGDRLRDFAIRLHFAHTYPTESGTRFFWALIVDAMALSMAGWALTGLYMWWQMKTLRRIGAVVLVVTAVATLPLVLSMWRELA
jgi:hypothetical protein